MKEAAHLRSGFCQLIVKRDRRLGLLDVKWHAANFEKVDRLVCCLQGQLHTAAEDNNPAALG